MAKSVSANKRRVEHLTFTRHKRVYVVLDKICQHMTDIQCQPDLEWLALIHEWLLVPYTLWPNDFKGLGQEICRQLETVKKIDDDIIAILSYLREIPSDKAQTLVAAVEKRMKEGDYDFCLTEHAKAKFKLHEKKLLENPVWQADWLRFCQRHDVAKIYDDFGMLRRSLNCERNVRQKQWYYRGGSKEENYQNELDALCYKHLLYGVQNGRPLLLKLSVNPTPHGSMLFMPAYWSFDNKRDIKWAIVNSLQKAREIRRQRKNSVETREQYEAKIKQALQLKLAAEAEGLQGLEKDEYICKGLGISVDTDESTLRRWIREAEKLLKEEAKQAAIVS